MALTNVLLVLSALLILFIMYALSYRDRILTEKKWQQSGLNASLQEDQKILDPSEAPLKEIIKKEFGQEINPNFLDYYLPLMKDAKTKAKEFSPLKFELNLKVLSGPKPPRPRAFYSPGDSLEKYLQYLAYDYRNKQSEYFLIGVFKAETPQWTYEIKGRSAWVTFNWDEILSKIKSEGTLTDGIAILHNHPISSKYAPPSLYPTDEDLSTSFYAYYTAKRYGYKFLGAYILSKGLYLEYLKKALAICVGIWASYMKSHLANILSRADRIISKINQALESSNISAEEMEKYSEELKGLISYVQELGNIRQNYQTSNKTTDSSLIPEITGDYPQEILSLTKLYLENINHLREEIEGLRNKPDLGIDDLKSLIKPYNLKAQEWVGKIQEICELLDFDFFQTDVKVQGQKYSETRFVTVRLQME